MKTRYAFAPVLVAGLAAGVILTGCSKSPFKPIPAAEVNQTHKSTAERAAVAVFGAWRDGKFDPLSDDFTQQMKDALPPAAQKGAYQNIKAMFGEFQSLEFVEAVVSPNLAEMVVYRFRAQFSGTSQRPEIRVVLDEQGKVSGFWCKPWRRTVR